MVTISNNQLNFNLEPGKVSFFLGDSTNEIDALTAHFTASIYKQNKKVLYIKTYSNIQDWRMLFKDNLTEDLLIKKTINDERYFEYFEKNIALKFKGFELHARYPASILRAAEKQIKKFNFDALIIHLCDRYMQVKEKDGEENNLHLYLRIISLFKKFAKKYNISVIFFNSRWHVNDYHIAKENIYKEVDNAYSTENSENFYLFDLVNKKSYEDDFVSLVYDIDKRTVGLRGDFSFNEEFLKYKYVSVYKLKK